MTHLDDDRLLQLLAGEDDPEGEHHLRGCSPCRERLAEWEGLLATARELEREAVTPGEQHRLMALFRELRPEPQRRSFVARVLEGSLGMAAASARGLAASRFCELGAGPWRVRLQLRPGTRGGFDLHGQVGSGEGESSGGGRLVLTRRDGLAVMAPVDEFGEFHVAALPEGEWSLTWWLGGDRIDLDRLVVTGDTGEEPSCG